MNLNMNAPLLYDDRSGRQIQHDVRPPTAHLRQYEVHAEFYYFSSWVNIHMKYTYYLRGIYELNTESGPMSLKSCHQHGSVPFSHLIGYNCLLKFVYAP